MTATWDRARSPAGAIACTRVLTRTWLLGKPIRQSRGGKGYEHPIFATLGSMRAIAVPVKPLSRSKSRLSSALSPLERGALTLAMLEDVLDACLAVPGWQTWVVSPDEAVLEIAARRGAQPMPEAKPPLSAAVRQAEEEAIGRGDEVLAVLLAHCPLLT